MPDCSDCYYCRKKDNCKLYFAKGRQKALQFLSILQFLTDKEKKRN